MLPQMCALPQWSASYLWSRIRNRRDVRRAEFIRLNLHWCDFPHVRSLRINTSAKGEVWRGEGGVTEVVLHHMFDLFPSIRMESIHFLSTATVPNQGQWGCSGLPVVGERKKCTLNTSPVQPSTNTHQSVVHSH